MRKNRLATPPQAILRFGPVAAFLDDLSAVPAVHVVRGIVLAQRLLSAVVLATYLPWPLQ